MLKLQQICKAGILCLTALTCATLAAQDKKRMGVATFEDSARSGLADSMTNWLVSELMRNRNYELIERTSLGKVMQEQGLGMTGVLDQSNVAQVGKLAGLDYIVLGDVTEAKAGTTTVRNSKTGKETHSTKFSVTANVKVVEVETGKIVLSENGEASRSSFTDRVIRSASPEQFSDAAQEAVAKAAFKIRGQIAPLEPAVIQVRAKELTLDLGREAGITEEERFLIIREGEPLLDRNGNLIGVDIIEIAHITITRVEATTSTAKIVKINKDPATKKEYVINRGDLARLQDRHGSARSAGEFFKGLTKTR